MAWSVNSFFTRHKLFDYVQKSGATETLHCELCVQARPSQRQDKTESLQGFK